MDQYKFKLYNQNKMERTYEYIIKEIQVLNKRNWNGLLDKIETKISGDYYIRRPLYKKTTISGEYYIGRLLYQETTMLGDYYIRRLPT